MSFLNLYFFPFFGEVIVAVNNPPHIVPRAVKKFDLKVIGRGFGFDIKGKFIIIGQFDREQFLYSAVTGSFCKVIIKADGIAR